MQFGGKAVVLQRSQAHLWLSQCILHHLFYFLPTPASCLDAQQMANESQSLKHTLHFLHVWSSFISTPFQIAQYANYPILLILQRLYYSFVKMFVYSFINFFAYCFKMEFHYTAQALCSSAWLWTYNIPASAWVLWLHVCVHTPSYFIILSPYIFHFCFSICLASMKKFPY